MLETFTPEALGLKPAKNLRTVDDIEGAIDVVYNWRLSEGLEDGIMTIQGWSVLEEPKGCSDRIKSLLGVY